MAQNRDTVLQQSLLRLVRRGAWGHAERLLEKSHPADIAQVLDRLTVTSRHSVFDLIKSTETRAEVLALLEFVTRADLLGGTQPEAAAEILERMDTDDAALVLRELPRETADEIIGSMGDGAAEIEVLLQHPPDTAGAIMAPDFFALNENLTVKEAIERIQERGSTEASSYVYVVEDHGFLVGVLSLRQLIVQPPYTVLRESMTPDPIHATLDMDQEEVARLVARYDLLAVPVVDTRNVLVGVVTVDDIIDVMRDEATEDILKLAGTTVEEVHSPGVLRGAWIRFPWLAASFVGGALGILLLDRFEDLLTSTVQIAFFLPVILGMGGNVASQCSMVVVRGLATGRIELGSSARIIAHEVGTSVLLAVTFAALLGGVASFLGYGPSKFPVVVALGMLVSMVIAGTLGTLFPLLFSRIGADPAVASGPFVTTSTDIAGIVGFCLVAYRLL